jgi:hypothetical protein
VAAPLIRRHGPANAVQKAEGTGFSCRRNTPAAAARIAVHSQAAAHIAGYSLAGVVEGHTAGHSQAVARIADYILAALAEGRTAGHSHWMEGEGRIRKARSHS